jgi:hypothetical protein
MERIWDTYKSGEWIEPFLIISTLMFIAASIGLYLMIIRSRAKKIKNAKLAAEYSIVIEKFIFSVLFNDMPFSEVKNDAAYLKLSADKFFRSQLSDSLINLHQNYEGLYAQKLERFYFESGLIRNSFKKLKSNRWEINCKGITELSEMNITKAFPSMVKLSKARNKTLKITALNACIKLNGTRGILHLIDHNDPIDDWTQVNIIHAFKKHDIDDTKGIELLLESNNTTVATLGLKLIKELKLSQKAPFVAQLAAGTHNNLLKFEAQNVLQVITA